MHSALIIDEVLEAMLEHCADWSGADYRWTLCQLARCCKAWKDPALDRLWKRLDAVEPLNRLGCTSETEVRVTILILCIVILTIDPDPREAGYIYSSFRELCIQSEAHRVKVAPEISGYLIDSHSPPQPQIHHYPR